MNVVKLENIMRVLTAFNHWWQLGDVTANYIFPAHRFAYNDIMHRITHNEKQRIITMLGPRKIGKTTLLHQVIHNLIASGIPPERIIYIPFSHPIFKFFSVEEILRIYHDNIYGGNDAFHLFDEIQLSPNWGEWTTSVCNKKLGARIIAAGTVYPKNYAENPAYPDELIKLTTLSFYEYCEIVAPDDIPKVPDWLTPADMISMSRYDQSALLSKMMPLRKHFARYILKGGFPGFLFSKISVDIKVAIQSAITHMLYNDIGGNFGIRNLDDLEKVFLYLCLQPSSVTSFEGVAKSLDCISRPTIEKYITLLEECGLIFLSNPIHISGKPVLKSQPKIYIADSAIRNAMTMQDPLMIDYTNLNSSAETAVYRHIRFGLASQSNTNAGYYRTNDAKKKTIDIIVNSPKGKTFIDIKYNDNYRVSHSDPIWSFCNEARQSFILTKHERDFGPFPGGPERLYRMPAHAYLFLLGHAERKKNK